MVVAYGYNVNEVCVVAISVTTSFSTSMTLLVVITPAEHVRYSG